MCNVLIIVAAYENTYIVLSGDRKNRPASNDSLTG